MLNKELLNTVADLIGVSTTYNQEAVVSECGSAGCIIGHTLAYKGYDYKKMHPKKQWLTAQKELGLTCTQAEDLFESYPDLYCEYTDNYTEEARNIPNWLCAKTMRHLADTGIVFWQVD